MLIDEMFIALDIYILKFQDCSVIQILREINLDVHMIKNNWHIWLNDFKVISRKI